MQSSKLYIKVSGKLTFGRGRALTAAASEDGNPLPNEASWLGHGGTGGGCPVYLPLPSPCNHWAAALRKAKLNGARGPLG